MSVTNIFPFADGEMVSAIEIRSYTDQEQVDNGKPVLLMIENGGMPDATFWDCMVAIKDALNCTPDHINLRPSEITQPTPLSFKTPEGVRWEFPNTQGRHTLGGGQKAVIDTIRREDLATVADKALREMRAMGLISTESYLYTLQNMKMLSFSPVAYIGPEGKADIESDPEIYQVKYGRALQSETRSYLQAKLNLSRPEGRYRGPNSGKKPNGPTGS